VRCLGGDFNAERAEKRRDAQRLCGTAESVVSARRNLFVLNTKRFAGCSIFRGEGYFCNSAAAVVHGFCGHGGFAGWDFSVLAGCCLKELRILQQPIQPAASILANLPCLASGL